MSIRGPRTFAGALAEGCVIGAFAFALAGCWPNHYLIHPRQAAPQTVVWSADFSREQLLMHIEGARPPGPGPFPVVIVHPDEDFTALDMRGVIFDLASHGYFAIAADYQRMLGGQYRRNYFVWRSAADLMLPTDATRAYPEADQNRIGAIGFSEGAVVSLLMAAHDPDRIKAVVAYSPITDFPRWYASKHGGIRPRILAALARWQLRDDAAAANPDEFQKMLRTASPIFMAEYIRAPVLMLHGAEDTFAPTDESERMAEKLKESGATVKVVLVPGGTRLFNFYQPELATDAWRQTLEWLDRYLR